ncbi:MAG: LCP family protein, partial [Acidimicrobiia bacterium]
DVLQVPPGVKLRRTWPQRLFLTLNVLLALACFAAAGGLLYVGNKTSQIQHIRLSHVLTDTQAVDVASEPMNILLVGVDSADGLDPDDPIRSERDEEGIGGLRSDTIMVLRVMPEEQRLALVSFPRDLYVEIAETGRYDKINSAMFVDGPEALISTIQNNFGIPLDHYVQVDFAQFKRLVDVVDGVKIYFDTAARDLNTGLDIAEPGCYTLTGDQALAYARSRYYQYWDEDSGSWESDPTADLGRISRQQDFIKRALGRAVDKGVRNPFTLNQLVNTGLDAVVLDDGLRAQDLIALGTRFRSFEPERLETYSLPVYLDSVGDASIVRLIESESDPILDVFRGVDPQDIDPASVGVRVLNGTGRELEASSTGEALAEVGFDVAGVGDTDPQDHTRTLVRFAPSERAGAELIVRYLRAGADLVEDPDITDGLVEVITGTDYSGVNTEPAPATTTTTTTAAGGVSSTTSTTEAVTSTTRYGIVPGADDPANDCR